MTRYVEFIAAEDMWWWVFPVPAFLIGRCCMPAAGLVTVQAAVKWAALTVWLYLLVWALVVVGLLVGDATRTGEPGVVSARWDVPTISMDRDTGE